MCPAEARRGCRRRGTGCGLWKKKRPVGGRLFVSSGGVGGLGGYPVLELFERGRADLLARGLRLALLLFAGEAVDVGAGLGGLDLLHLELEDLGLPPGAVDPDRAPLALGLALQLDLPVLRLRQVRIDIHDQLQGAGEHHRRLGLLLLGPRHACYFVKGPPIYQQCAELTINHTPGCFSVGTI